MNQKKKGASLDSAGPKKLLKIFTPEQTSVAPAPAQGNSSVSVTNGTKPASPSRSAQVPSTNGTTQSRTTTNSGITGKGRKTISIMDSLNQGYSRSTTSSAGQRTQTSSISNGRMPDMAEAFTAADVVGKMKEFVNVKGVNERVKSALTAHEPLLKDQHNVIMRVDNSIQEDDIRKIKSEILNFLKRELRNTKIDVETEIVQTRSGKKLYTDTDRFDYLAKKNPVLNVLKQKFSLDFD